MERRIEADFREAEFEFPNDVSLPRFFFGRTRRLKLARRQKRLPKGFMEIVTIFKIAARISFRFFEQAGFDHVEYDFPKITAMADAPFLENSAGHRAKLVERAFANTFQQLLPRDVLLRLAGFAVATGGPFVLVDLLLRMVERLADKDVGIAMKPRVFDADDIQCFVERNLVHVKNYAAA